MSLTTRCPSCHTLFRVVQDQLRISEGWVRCGQCSEIFDAATALVDADVEQPVSAEPPLEAQGFFSPEQESVDHVEIPLDGPADLPARVAPLSLEFGALDAPPEAVVVTPGAEPLTEETGTNEVAKPVQGQEPAQQAVVGYEPEQVMAPARPSFLREMPKPSPWHRGWVRVLLSMVTVTLLAALGGQVAVQERDRVAAMFPEARPVLSWMCEQAGCVVGALRRIESVVVEGSSFNKTRGDNYRLSLVLKNTSALDIALPALELTLTDSQDQAVMRRVLLPSDLGASTVLLKGGGEWSGNIALAVKPSSGADRFSGYRVLAFYP